MHEPKIDLSILDPSRDVQRWNDLVVSLAGRALAERQQRLTVGYQMSAWARPILAIAATVALALGLRAWSSHDEKSLIARHQVEPAYVLASWADKDEQPTTSNILQVFGEYNATE